MFVGEKGYQKKKKKKKKKGPTLLTLFGGKVGST